MTDGTLTPAQTQTPSGAQQPSGSLLTSALFAVAIFTSASLVFVVQPMVTKLILPLLGGSPAVWNTAMVFFQSALLAGYLYAHLLQKIGSLKLQAIVHLAALALAALFLPLQISGLTGEPDSSAPIFWLLATLVISIGTPFAILSATAPLLQAWFARLQAGTKAGQNPYVLYAASNLGSFLALLSYPVLIEPMAALSAQRTVWSLGYGFFIALVIGLALLIWSRRNMAAAQAPALERSAPIPVKRKLLLVLLAAIPSSLMLGVTSHLSTDVASAPFLWVVPLALYLLTFVIAFQNRPWIPLPVTLMLQAVALVLVVTMMGQSSSSILFLFGAHLLVFFLTTLMCHQQMAARKPAPDRLTEFYLLMSLGGVLGGAFTALLAPMLFKTVIEYPIVLVLACLVRSPDNKPTTRNQHIIAVAGVIIAASVPILFEIMRYNEPFKTFVQDHITLSRLAQFLILGAGICAFLIRDKVVMFAVIIALCTYAGQHVTRSYNYIFTDRSFFGVTRIGRTVDLDMGGDMHVMVHGTTLHGAQARHPQVKCQPTMYYANSTPLGQAALMVQKRDPAARMGIVGLGSGAMASYKRGGDTMTFFEIDPMVDRMARNPELFTFVSDCAQGPVDTVLGDARLTLQKQPKGSFDYLLIDAFSSDAVPAHLLTREAIAMYVSLLSDDGVVVLHLSNRHLDIVRPAMAAAEALKAPFLHQVHVKNSESAEYAEASTEAIIIARNEAALTDFKADNRWSAWDSGGVKPWTDDYVDLFGALRRHMQ